MVSLINLYSQPNSIRFQPGRKNQTVGIRIWESQNIVSVNMVPGCVVYRAELPNGPTLLGNYIIILQ